MGETEEERENARGEPRGCYREVRGREKARGVVVRYSLVLCGVRGYRSHRDISSGRPDTPLPSPGTAKAAAQKPWVPYALSFGLRPSELHALEFKYSCRRERGTLGSRKGMKGGKGGGGRTTRELPAVDGFPSRLENTIDPPVAFAHPPLRPPSLLFSSSSSPFLPPFFLPLASFRFFPPLSVARLSSRLETDDEETRENALR